MRVCSGRKPIQAASKMSEGPGMPSKLRPLGRKRRMGKFCLPFVPRSGVVPGHGISRVLAVSTLPLPPCPFPSLFYSTMNPRIKHSNLFEKTLDSSSGGCYTIPENKAEPQCVLTYERSSSMVNTKKTGKSRVFVLKSAGCVVCALFVVGFDLGCMEVLNY